MKLLVFGLGFSATALVNRIGRQWIADGGTIAATTRSHDKAEAMTSAGVIPHLFDGTGPGDDALRESIESATHILMSISPHLEEIAPGSGVDPVLHFYRSLIAQNRTLEWIGYFSTVGVYGNHDGAWVDEDATCYPVSRRSKARVLAEQEWVSLGETIDVPVALIRLAGIYGPSRNTFVNLQKGKARRIIKPGQVFNRIHVDDIAGMTEAMMARRAGGVFNGADDEPAPPQDVVAFAAKMMDVPCPPDIAFEDAELSPMGRSFYGEVKRVSNRRLARDLDYTLTHPTYRAALTTMWDEGTWNQPPVLKALHP